MELIVFYAILIAVFIYIFLQYASKKRMINMLRMLIYNENKYYVGISFAENIQSVLIPLFPSNIDKSLTSFEIEKLLINSSLRPKIQVIFDSILVLYAIEFEKRCTACKEFDDFAKSRRKTYLDGIKFSRELLQLHAKEEKERRIRLEKAKKMFWEIHAIVKKNGWDTFPSYLDYLILEV